MNEMIKVYNRKRKPYPDFINRKLLPMNGFYFRIINVWIIDKNKNILIQKRSPTKTLFPNKFECVAGALIGEETPIDAIKREISEELNIKTINIKNIVNIHESICDKPSYFCSTFIYVIDKIDISSLKYNFHEVSMVQAINFDELNKIMKTEIFCDDIKLRFKKYKAKLKKIINNL